MKLLASLLMAAVLAAPALPAFCSGCRTGTTGGQARPGQGRGQLFPRFAWPATRLTAIPAIAVNPKLAQQHPEYLVKQLQEFKSGKRANAIMQGFASMLSDEDMKNVAAWLASKPAKAENFAKDKTWSPWASASTAAALQTADCRLRRLPQPQRRRHSCAVPALRASMRTTPCPAQGLP
jgi:hypothetical protein